VTLPTLDGMADGAEAAWQAFEEGRFTESDELWRRCIASAGSERERDAHRSRHAYVLIALARFEEARAVYRELFERHGSHRYLHQLAMVEREAGNLDRARELLEREAGMLPAEDALARGANLYERTLVHHRLGRRRAAAELLDACLGAAQASGDPTMLGAAHRLEGDLAAGTEPRRARAAYERAIAWLRTAGDEYGVAEVERRIAALEA